MKMTLNQTKLVGLTMKLELKAKEYQELCKQFDELKKIQGNTNSEEFSELLAKFQNNLEEIKQINLELQNIKKDNK